ncbi:MAG: 3-deoxy-D-manno-octulosonic acid transferase [Desulfobacterales bacterium]|nr:3-deoxy-D-manno-octulosonic acid transferase [Desulfobacterales bacterium]
MSPLLSAYRILSLGFWLSLLPVYWLCRYGAAGRGRPLCQRLGVYPPEVTARLTGRPRIWLHAVSVGEVGAAEAIILSLQGDLPQAGVILSTTTAKGQAVARARLGDRVLCVYAPLDFTWAVRRAMRDLKPDILVLLETEIWPNWLIEARRLGIRTALVNGRISVRSIGNYLKIQPLMQEILSRVDAFSMIRQQDAERIHRIGAPQHKLAVNGNAKYDLLLSRADPRRRTEMAQLYRLQPAQPVLVAGSTRHPEERFVLEAYARIAQSLPDTLLIIAPRHVERVPQLEALIRRQGFPFQLRSALNHRDTPRWAPIVVLDTIGELYATYSIASVVFCGGSLVTAGGQNVLEAAVWGTPVLYGFSMEDFLDAKDLLERTGGGIQVKDGGELAEKALFFLTHARQAARIGAAARQAVVAHQGAAAKHAEVIRRLLGVLPARHYR